MSERGGQTAFEPLVGVWVALGALTIAFHLWLVLSGLTPNLVARPLHMALAVPWVVLYGRRPTLSGFGLTAAGVGACLYIAWNHSALGDQYGMLFGTTQYVVAFVLLGVVLEMARRAIGWPLPLVALLSLLYAFFGEYIPGEF
ncbi:MAG: TRAP transporter permease DctM/Q, partial [Pseudomonadota bacterium]